jgi:hypothetical protein
MKKLLVVVMSFTLVAVVAAPVAAQENPTGSSVGAVSEPGAAVTLLNKKQTKVTFDMDNVIANLPNGSYAPIDAAKVINCGTTTCVISAEITLQVGPSSPANAADCPIAFRFVVDGADVNPGSNQFVNVIDSAENDFFFDNASQQITTPNSRAPGNHSVQSFAGSFGPGLCARRSYHHIQYSQFKP